MKRVKEIDRTRPPARGMQALPGDTLALFEKYGARYGFDPLMLAAQGYQESQLRPGRAQPRRARSA